MCRKFRLLKANEIEVKIKQVVSDGAYALIYKTARVDMDILDETVGAENWQDDYKEIKGNLYCGIAIRDEMTSAFSWKWDCGIESRADNDGNEKKGEASDAFKRAGVKWGIGRELYTAPVIKLKVQTKEKSKDKNGKTIYELQYPFTKYYVESVDYENNEIIKLKINDEYGNEVYSFGYKKSNLKSKIANESEKHDLPFPDNGARVKQPSKEEIKANRQMEVSQLRKEYYSELQETEWVQLLKLYTAQLGKKISDMNETEYLDFCKKITKREL